MKKPEVNFTLDDFVWAKVVGSPYWPALLVQPNKHVPETHYKHARWVYFFGTHNYAWIQDRFVKPFEEFKSKFMHKCSKGVEEAAEEADQYRTRLKHQKSYKIPIFTFSPQKRRSKSRNRRVSRSSRKSRASTLVDDFNNDVPEYTNVEEVSIRHETTQEIADRVGVLACNLYAEHVVKNLLKYGHKVLVWSTSKLLLADLQMYALTCNYSLRICESPREVVKRSSIIFSLMSSSAESLSILTYYENQKSHWASILFEKVYVEMTLLSYRSSCYLKDFMKKRRAAYLEALIQGTMKEVEDRTVYILIGLHQHESVGMILLNTYKSCFEALTDKNRSYVVGDVGVCTQIQLIIQTIKTLCLAGFCEVLALAHETSVFEQFMEIFEYLPLFSNYFKGICKSIKSEDYDNVQESIGLLQQGLQKILDLGDRFCEGIPLTSLTNELLKGAQRVGLNDRDSSAMFLFAHGQG